MKKIAYPGITALIIGLAIWTILTPNPVIFQGLTQILGGIVGGFIALIGVSWTLREQQKQFNEQWIKQLELSREEWKRQDERYKEEWRIKVQPWFEIPRAKADFSCSLILKINDGSPFNVSTRKLGYYAVKYKPFSLLNIGKDIAKIIGIEFISSIGTCIFEAEKNAYIENNRAVYLEIRDICFLEANEIYTLSLLYCDIFNNHYKASLNLERVENKSGCEELEDGTEYSYVYFLIKEIEKPFFIEPK